MLGNYKKIAILDYKSQPIPLSKGLLKWKLEFEPKQIIVCVSDFSFDTNTWNLIPSPIDDTFPRALCWVKATSQDCWKGTVKTFDKNALSWKEDITFGYVNKNLVGISYVIAIG